MDKAILTLIEAGLEAAGMLFEYLSEDAKRQAKELDAAAVDAELREQRLREIISNSATRLEESIRAGCTAVIDKIESDKLEELIARTKNLAMVLGMRRSETALQYAFTVNESVEYARRRVEEGKRAWTGPWLAGQATFIAALELSGADSGSARRALEQAAQRVRFETLNALAPTLLAQSSPPWELIAAFTRGENTSLLRELPPPQSREAALAKQHSPERDIFLAAGEVYCLKCLEIYSAKGTACPRCSRMNGSNLSLTYPIACLACKDSRAKAKTNHCTQCFRGFTYAIERA